MNKQILLWTRLLLGSLLACCVVHADSHANWRLVHGNPAPSGRIRDLEYAMGRWIVVGDEFTGWSDDGFEWHWQRRTDGLAEWMELKIVVGYRKDGSPLLLSYPVRRSDKNIVEYLSSVDGIHWEPHRIFFENSSQGNYQIIPNPNHERPWLLIVGDGSQPIQAYQSTDGFDWDGIQFFEQIRDVQWGSDGLLVLTPNSLSYTEDLQTWIPVSVSTDEVSKENLAWIEFHTNRWFVQSWSDGLWWSSFDLKNWVQEPDYIESAQLLDFSAQPDLVGALRPNERLRIVNDQTWLEVPWEWKNSRLLGVDVGKEDEEGVFVMVGLSTGQNILATDNKRLNWSLVPEWWSLRGSRKEERKPEYFQQSDNWSEEGEVLHSNGTWVVRTAFSELLVSRDGLSWDCVNCSLSDGEDILSIAYDGEKWLRAQKHHLLLSDDLVNWNRIGPDIDLPTPNGYMKWNHVDVIDGEYFALGQIVDPGFCDDKVAVVYSSSDLLRWHKRISLRNALIHSVDKVYGKWLVLGNTLGACEGMGSSYGVAWTSSDLVNWQFHSGKRDGLFQYGPFYEGVSGSGDDWLLAVSGYETGGIYQLNPDYSIDQLPEIEHDEDQIVMYNDIRFVNHHWVAIGSITESSDGESFRDYFIQTSSDGLHWETRFSSSELVLQKVYFSEGEWLVTETGGALLRSENGFDWILETLPGGIRTRDAVYSSGHWVLVGENGTVLVEPDALTGETGLILETHENQIHLSWMGNFPPHGAWIEWSQDLKQWHAWEPFESIQHTELPNRFIHKTPIIALWEREKCFYRVRY